ncbi:MAG TPA: quinone-dependent dihydroorotate dehydrogenase [Rhizomicrobium sp.]|nr:quinone-dependent dihydroorotate dehydrogenase [Rhizomicrobium sp.]
MNVATIFDVGAAALRALPAEGAHRATLALLQVGQGLIPQHTVAQERLAQRVFGLDFPNPVGLAAGFDKNAEVPDAMLRFGFGFVECGTVTPRPQIGNPKPRLFRLPEDRAVINRMGFNNGGMEAAAARLKRRKRQGLVGINIGANKDTADRVVDYRVAFARLAPLADYVTANISSPNTPGLRGLQNRAELERLLETLTAEREHMGLSVPLLLKIAPDLELSALDDIASVVLASGIDGLIVSNTTIARPESLKSKHARETGGLSGAPLFEPSTQILREMRRRIGSRLPLIGVGGIASGAQAYAKIRAGASLVQLYSALALQGPGLVGRMLEDLAALLARDGFANVAAAVGADVA